MDRGEIFNPAKDTNLEFLMLEKHKKYDIIPIMGQVTKLNYHFYDEVGCQNPEQAYACHKIDDKKYSIGLKILVRHDFLSCAAAEKITPDSLERLVAQSKKCVSLPTKMSEKFKPLPKPHPCALSVTCDVDFSKPKYKDLIERASLRKATAELPSAEKRKTFSDLNMAGSFGQAEDWTGFLSDYKLWLDARRPETPFGVATTRFFNFAAHTVRALSTFNQQALVTSLVERQKQASFLYQSDTTCIEAHTSESLKKNRGHVKVSCPQRKLLDFINMAQVLSILPENASPLYSSDEMNSFATVMSEVYFNRKDISSAGPKSGGKIIDISQANSPQQQSAYKNDFYLIKVAH